MREWGTIVLSLASASLLAGCWSNERQYPFLNDARSAKAAGDSPRALGAARALLDHREILESPQAEIAEARTIADEAEYSQLTQQAEQALTRAATLPTTREGLAERLALLMPIADAQGDLARSPYPSRARTLLLTALTPFWDRVESEIDVETYDAGLDVIEKSSRRVNAGGALPPHVARTKLRMVKAHEERAEATNASPLGVAQRWWHLQQANELGAKHDLSREKALLADALSVATSLTSLEPNAECGVARSDIERLLVPRGKSTVTIAVRVNCGVTTDTKTERRTRQDYEEVVKYRFYDEEVQVGTRTERYTEGGGEHCSTAYDTRTGRDVKAFCGHSSGTRMTREVPVYKTEKRAERYKERVPVDVSYELVTKTRTALLKFTVTTTFPDGTSSSDVVSGTGSSSDQATSGSAGEFAKSFSGKGPSDRELLANARASAIDSLPRLLGRQDNLERERKLRELRGASTDPDGEEAYRAALVWVGGPTSHAARLWLRERWGGKPPSGELRAAIDDVEVPFTPKPLTATATYTYEKPQPVGYLNTAHGAGWLVTTGAGIEMGAKETAIAPGRTDVWFGGSAALGGRMSAFRASAAGSSTSILGDVNGFALGGAYARSLRGGISDHHRFELVWSLGITGGVSEVDGGLAPPPAKARFVRVPVALTASVPFYLVSFQARAALEPNLYSLFPETGWQTPHIGSLWLGVLPVPWFVVEGGVEMALESSVSGPLFGLRSGVRL